MTEVSSGEEAPWRGGGCVVAAILDAIAGVVLLAVLFTLTLAVAGLIITGVMVREGQDVDAGYVLMASVIMAVDLALLGGFVWLAVRLRRRPALCAACGQAAVGEEARLCERCAIRGEEAAPRRLLYGGRLAGVAAADDGVTKGSLVIRRKPGILNYAGGWHVILDEKDIGTIGRGEERRFEVPSGPHAVRLKIGSYRTNSIEFAANEHDVLLECGRDEEEAVRLLIEPLIWRPSRTYRLTRMMGRTDE